MSEFRQNFATKEWVIIAPERSDRPADFSGGNQVLPSQPSFSESCPFCPGNEHETVQETLRYGGGDKWSVRVVRNRYSALHPNRSTRRIYDGLFLKSDSYGYAEVIIETPSHNATIATLPQTQLELVLRAYRERSAVINEMPNISILMLFRNFGPGAGTSLEHPHSQIIASPIIPPHIRDPFQKAALHYDSFGSCVYCDMIEEEIRQSVRIIYQNEHFISFCPFASRTPFEMRIYPKRHMASYFWITDDELPFFADVLGDLTRRMRRVLGNPSYNFIIRSAPIGDEDVRYLHWYFVLIPKISTPAGFEIGSGVYINPFSPEYCTEILREGNGLENVEQV